MSEDKVTDYGATASREDTLEGQDDEEDQEWELNKVLETIGLFFSL